MDAEIGDSYAGIWADYTRLNPQANTEFGTRNIEPKLNANREEKT
jgi:hypothetical protein